MNKLCHKIIFNKKRGQLMVVAETAVSDGKSPAAGNRVQAGVKPLWVTLRPLCHSFLLSFGLIGLVTPAAVAQIVADRNAPKTQQPVIAQAANGVPLVNIQTPSAAGVSRNTYSQFDVQQQGAVLNNARNNAQTQLGGWVQGNPNLAGGSARVILNEVNSSSPSQLRGYVEVGGDRAQVVIANPAGITCDGCGFINTQRATLTTGSPVINGDGGIDGYRVQSGQIRIEGNGLDASRTDYTDIIARSVQVNAGIWASQLRVTTGANEVNSDNTAATPIAATGSSPSYAIDVAQLGGMYANKIVLVGTENGVGVRNAGQIGAVAGDVTISADGRLLNTGRINSSGQTKIDTNAGIENSGIIYAQGDAQITTRADIINTGGTIAANGLAQLSSVGLNNSQGTIGTIQGNLTIDAGTGLLNNQEGSITAASDISLTSRGLNNTDGVIGGAQASIDTRLQSFNNTRGTVVADGTARIQSGTLTNDAGLIQAYGSLDIDTNGQTLNNQNAGSNKGIRSFDSLSLKTGQLDNTAGFIGASGVIGIDASTIKNTSGAVITGGQAIRVAASSLDNTGSQIQAVGYVDLQVGGQLNNTTGLIHSDQALTVTASNIDNHNTQTALQGIEGQSVTLSADQVNNNAGAIKSNQNLVITSAGTVDNTGGLTSAGQNIQVLDPNASLTSNAATKTLGIANDGGKFIAGGDSLKIDAAAITGNGQVLSQNDISIKLLGDVIHAGRIGANRDTTIETTGKLTNSGSIQSGNQLNIQTAEIDNQTTGQIAATSTNLKATASHTLTNRGLIDGSDTFIDAITLNNLGTGRIYGDHIAISATTLTNDVESGIAPVIAARSRLDIGATTINNRENALIFTSGDMSIGGALDANHNAIGQANALNNASATIEALGNLNINAGQINNTN